MFEILEKLTSILFTIAFQVFTIPAEFVINERSIVFYVNLTCLLIEFDESTLAIEHVVHPLTFFCITAWINLFTFTLPFVVRELSLVSTPSIFIDNLTFPVLKALVPFP